MFPTPGMGMGRGGGGYYQFRILFIYIFHMLYLPIFHMLYLPTTRFRPFSTLNGTNMFINPIPISLKWPILTFSPHSKKQHISLHFELKETEKHILEVLKGSKGFPYLYSLNIMLRVSFSHGRDRVGFLFLDPLGKRPL